MSVPFVSRCLWSLGSVYGVIWFAGLVRSTSLSTGEEPPASSTALEDERTGLVLAWSAQWRSFRDDNDNRS
jgi:hypothetical protein